MQRKEYKELVKHVKREARNIKKYATLGERSNLNFDTLSPSDPHKCIYGQMIGSCFSYEAQSLIEKCCKEFYNNLYSYSTPQLVPHEISNPKYRNYYTPIELFINYPLSQYDPGVDKRELRKIDNENNKILIEYLREEHSELNFIIPNERDFN